MDKKNGSITCMLAGTILLVIALIFTATEVTRVRVAKANATNVTDIAASSMFSGYAREIYEDYGIMCIWKDGDELTESFTEYADNNIRYSDAFMNNVWKGMEMECGDISVDITETPVSDYGEGIYDQIYDYEVKETGVDMAKYLLGQITGIDQLEGLSGITEDIQECYDALSELSKAKKAICQSINEIKDLKEQISSVTNVYDYVSDFNEMINNLQEGEIPSRDYLEEWIKDYADIYEGAKGWVGCNENELSDIKNNIEGTKEKITNSENEIEELKRKIELNKENYDEQVYNSLNEELEAAKASMEDEKKVVEGYEGGEINEGTKSNEADETNGTNGTNETNETNGTNETNEIIAENRIQDLGLINGSLDNDFFSGLYEGNDDDMGNMAEMKRQQIVDTLMGNLAENKDYKNEINSYLTEAQNIRDVVNNYDVSGLYIDYGGDGNDNKKPDIAEFIDGIRDDGFLEIVTNKDLSDKCLGDMSLTKTDMISEKYGVDDGDDFYYWGEPEDSVRRIVFGQYVLKHFGSYDGKVQTEEESKNSVNVANAVNADDNDNVLEYGAEYVIAGKDNDKDNLKKVISNILVIREGVNIAHIFSDGEKLAQVKELALATVGFTGMPALVYITELVIISAWSYGESLMDVRDLLDGKKIELIKTNRTWHLDLKNVLSLTCNEVEEPKTGICYEDFLRFFMFTKNKSTSVLRVMDLIELNIRKNYREDFRMADCVLEVSVNAEYRMKELFTDLNFVKRWLSKDINGYLFYVETEYNY